MLQKLDQIDRSLFFILNGYHSPAMDAVMWYFSKMLFWIPIYLILLFALYKKYKWKYFMLAILCVSGLVFVTDFSAVHLIKNTVMRLRPSHQPEIMDRVNLVKDSFGNFYAGGMYGFFSNHASNYFGVVVFFILIMQPLKKFYSVLLLFWILLICYSRIYLGVHYPGDILGGAIFGSVIGWLFSLLFIRIYKSKTATT